MIGWGCIPAAGRLERQDPAASPAQPVPSRVEPIMCDESKPSGAASRSPSPGSPLSEIAHALGVPVSSFFVSDAAVPTEGDLPDATALLDLVRAYLLRVGPETRARFVARVAAMAEEAPR